MEEFLCALCGQRRLFERLTGAASCIQNVCLRARPIRERREVDVVSGPRADGAQQRAVHPDHERAVQLARPLERLAVLVHRGDEDVLHLKIPARVQQRQGVGEALGRAARDVKPDIVGRFRQQDRRGAAASALAARDPLRSSSNARSRSSSRNAPHSARQNATPRAPSPAAEGPSSNIRSTRPGMSARVMPNSAHSPSAAAPGMPPRVSTM